MGVNSFVVWQRLGAPIVVLVGLSSLLAGCGKEPVPPARQPPDVTVMTVTARDTPVTFEFVAQTQSSREVEIRARVAGFLDKRQYTEGDHVIFVGEVERCRRDPNGSPLLYHGGRFYTEHPLQASTADPSAPQPPDGRFVGSYLGYLLGQASHAVYRDFENAIAAEGLTHIAWRVLAVLHDAELAPDHAGIPIGQLAHDVLAKQPTVTKLVQRMADDGLVALLADPADQRRTLVVATGEGRRIAAALIEQARAQETTLLSRWSAHEAEALKRHLQRLVNEEPPRSAAARVAAPRGD